MYRVRDLDVTFRTQERLREAEEYRRWVARIRRPEPHVRLDRLFGFRAPTPQSA